MAATATRPRRLTALERQAMTPEQDLELLIAEQARDDSRYQDHEKSAWWISLDAVAPSGEGGSVGAELVGRDPWDLVDAAIDLGLDPGEVAYAGDLVDSLPPQRGTLLSGLLDPQKTPHGTAGGYQNHRCRCIPCTAAWATYKRERRAARKAAA